VAWFLLFASVQARTYFAREDGMSARLRVDQAQCAVEGRVTVARVGLTHHGRAASGMASARTTEGVWRQVVAEATLSAVREMIDGKLEVSLDTVAEVGSAHHPIVVVTMTIGRGRNEVFLSGTAPLVGDRVSAIAKAVLHGLNRWVEPFLAVVAEDPTVPRARAN
jgi:hypothetical protein